MASSILHALISQTRLDFMGVTTNITDGYFHHEGQAVNKIQLLVYPSSSFGSDLSARDSAA
jgi:hypothetical protein